MLLPFLFCFVLAACSGSDKMRDGEPDFRLAQYQTFAFGDMADVSTEDMRFSTPQFADRVRAELRHQMPQHGLEYDSQSKELLVYFFTIPDQDEDISLTAIPYVSSANIEIAEVSRNHNFIIDVVDAQQNVLLWRTSSAVDPGNSEWRNRVLPDIIKIMLRDIPS